MVVNCLRSPYEHRVFCFNQPKGTFNMAPRKPAKKATAKRVIAKKPVARKTAARKPAKRKVIAAAKPTAARIAAVKDAFSKAQIMTHISEVTDLKKKEIVSVFEALGTLMERHLKKRGVGEFTLPGLLKCRVVRKPATKERKGINPFTGEPTTFKAKPARNVVKIRPLKKLKEMAE